MQDQGFEKPKEDKTADKPPTGQPEQQPKNIRNWTSEGKNFLKEVTEAAVHDPEKALTDIVEASTIENQLMDTGHVPPDSETTDPPRAEDGTIILPETQERLNDIATRYNQWLKQGDTENAVSTIYEPKFDEKGNLLDGEVELVLASAIGLGSAGDEVTAEELRQALHRYYAELEKKPDHVETVRTACTDFNKHCERYGLTATFDPARIILLPQARFEAISHNLSGHLAYTDRFRDNPNSFILIPIDHKQLRDQDHLYDVVVHELGHSARHAIGIDPSDDSDATYLLEEAIIQDNTNTIAWAENRASKRTEYIYSEVTWVAKPLAEALGVESLIGLSHEQIRELMNVNYPHLTGLMDEPYDMFTEELEEYENLYQSLKGQKTGDHAQDNQQKENYQRMIEDLQNIKQHIISFYGLKV